MKNKWDEIAGKWKQFSAEAKKRWNELTDDELNTVNGNRDTLAGLIQKRYTIAKKEANKQIEAWTNKMKV